MAAPRGPVPRTCLPSWTAAPIRAIDRALRHGWRWLGPGMTSCPTRPSISPMARPTGADATNQIVLVTTEQAALNDENVLFTTSTNGGATGPLRPTSRSPGDRGYYSAPAISPNGTDAWIVYNAFLEPFKTSAEGAANDRPLDAVVLHADVASNGAVGPFSLDPPQRLRRREGFIAEQPRRRVPRRLRLRGRHPDIWRGSLERRPKCGRLPGHR